MYQPLYQPLNLCTNLCEGWYVHPGCMCFFFWSFLLDTLWTTERRMQRLVQRLVHAQVGTGWYKGWKGGCWMLERLLKTEGCGASGRLFILFFWGTGSVFKIHCGNFSHHNDSVSDTMEGSGSVGIFPIICSHRPRSPPLCLTQSHNGGKNSHSGSWKQIQYLRKKYK